MFSKRLYFKIILSVVFIVLLSFATSLLLMRGYSYTLGFACLVGILFMTLFLIRLTNRTNQQLSIFFSSLLNNDPTRYYSEKTDDPFLFHLYTEMNRITSHLGESRAEVEEKQRYYESILRVLTHEVRNLITPVASLSGDLLKQLDVDRTDELRDGLEVINGQAKSVVAFLDSYHRLTHLPDPVKQNVEIHTLFEKLKRLLSGESGSSSIVYTSPQEMIIHADPNLTLLVLINLIRNGLQAITEQTAGLIRVEASEDENYQYITVADNGLGIPEEFLSAVFAPFYSTKKEGSGIGLSLSQRIMQLHGGKLTVFSEPKVKTVFTLSFPFC